MLKKISRLSCLVVVCAPSKNPRSGSNSAGDCDITSMLPPWRRCLGSPTICSKCGPCAYIISLALGSVSALGWWLGIGALASRFIAGKSFMGRSCLHVLGENIVSQLQWGYQIGRCASKDRFDFLGQGGGHRCWRDESSLQAGFHVQLGLQVDESWGVVQWLECERW
jgi:hypothetical protein